MKPHEDAYGQMMLDHLRGRGGYEIVERDDGNVSVGAGPALYFSEFDQWREAERDAMAHVKGRVLDIGCGAGRFMLHLKARGHEVTGIDVSPGAIEVCSLRGLEDLHVMSVGQVSPRLGMFDTLLMLGGNLGLLGDSDRGRRVLARLHRVAQPGAVLLGASRDRTQSADPAMQQYVSRNLAAGRLSGYARNRIRYKKFATPFAEYLRITITELRSVIEGTGWRLGKVIDRSEGIYIGVLERT